MCQTNNNLTISIISSLILLGLVNISLSQELSFDPLIKHPQLLSEFNNSTLQNGLIILLAPNESSSSSSSSSSMLSSINGYKNENHTLKQAYNIEQVNSTIIHNNNRASRKVNILNGFWNKPKISPLYLINGTVCRFVNSAPICTTLSTQGLLPSGSVSGPRSTASTPRTAAASSSVVFASQNQAPPAFRPAAIVEDEPQEINLSSSQVNEGTSSPVNEANSRNQNIPILNGNTQTTSSSSPLPQRQLYSSALIQQTLRPVQLTNRRTLNILSLRRPAVGATTLMKPIQLAQG